MPFFKKKFSRDRIWVHNIKNSVVTIYKNVTLITRQNFQVNENWFNQLFIKHFTSESRSKYDPGLFQDQYNQGQRILSQITFDNKSSVLNEIRVLVEWITDFERDYNSMLLFFKREQIQINEMSIQHKQFEHFLATKEELRRKANTWSEAYDSQDFNMIHRLSFLHINFEFDPIEIRSVYDYKFEKLSSYPANEKYLNNPPKKDDWYNIEFPFRRLKEIDQHLTYLNHFLYESFNQINIVTGDAGMGKSNLSAHLVIELRQRGFPVIFVRAKAFNENPDDFEGILLRALDTPVDYTLTEVLEKLNNYGKKTKKRVTIIIDALNETTFQGHGFSSIWRDHLDDFLSRLSHYDFLFFIATLRNSYITRIWPNGQIPHSVVSLTGFSESVIVPIVEKYFSVYNISYDDLRPVDIFYFRTPLLLYLYCEMLNSKKTADIQAVLGLSGFQEVFEKYINNLCAEIKSDLSLPSINRILNGFSIISKEMAEEIQAFVDADNFYDFFQGEPVANINNTIGNKILEGYLIYVKDSINNRDVITHTQQEVGGYLLAKYLNEEHGDVNKVISSDFFQNHIIGLIEDRHQLADDIIKFLVIDKKVALVLMDLLSPNSTLDNYALNLLQREPTSSEITSIKNKFIERNRDQKGISELFKVSKSRLLDISSALNLVEIKDLLVSLSNHDFELRWTQYLYEDWAGISDFLDHFNSIIPEWKNENELSENDKLFIEFLIFILESTNRNHRDKATILLIEICEYHYQYILDKLKFFLGTNRLYIIERLTTVIYGVILRRQNDSSFIQTELKSTAQYFYDNQFAPSSTNSMFHYIVIDCMKHTIDLAIEKKILNLEIDQLSRLKKYSFTTREWTKPSGSRIAQFQECGYTPYTHKCPDPFRMDFVIYTVPRLGKKDNYVKIAEALANIYQRLIDAGYISKEEFEDKRESEFYFGTTPFLVRTKIDRLGKKYSWNAFFEYAGYLLSQDQLPIWNEDETINDELIYERLSDVEFEVSNPNPDLSLIRMPVFKDNLLDVKSGDSAWVDIQKFDVIWEIWKTIFDQQEYTMLYGYIENKPDANYEVRSFLAIDAYLIKKEDLKNVQDDLNNLVVDWKRELYGSKTISKTYFGELYWADNIPLVEAVSNSIELEKIEEVDRPLTIYDIMDSDAHKGKMPGDMVKVKERVQLNFSIEPTTADYLWESDRESTAQESYRDYIPSPQIGKYLNLKADVERFQLLDNELRVATKSVYWENNGMDKQNMNYLRSDLLQKYMDDNQMALLYEVRQFTHDQTILPNGGQVDLRKIKYILPHLRAKK